MNSIIQQRNLRLHPAIPCAICGEAITDAPSGLVACPNPRGEGNIVNASMYHKVTCDPASVLGERYGDDQLSFEIPDYIVMLCRELGIGKVQRISEGRQRLTIDVPIGPQF